MNPISIQTGTGHVVVACPHAGMCAPGIDPDMADRARDRHSLRLAQDIARAVDGALVTTRMSRLWCDVTGTPDGRGPHADRPAIPETGPDGARLYADGGEPSWPERGRRLTGLYRPWHTLVGTLVQLAAERDGHAVLVSVHTHRTGEPIRIDGDLTAMRAAKALTAATGEAVALRPQGHDTDKAAVRLSVRDDLAADKTMRERIAAALAGELKP